MNQETKTKLLKTAKGAAIAAGGVGLTYFLQGISSMDFGSWTAVVVGVTSVLINAINQFSKKYEG